MFDKEIIYEVNTFAIGDTKSGAKMGKLQLKNPEDGSLLNCILWEETLHKVDLKLFRNGNKLRIISGSYNEKFNNCLVSALELVQEAPIGLTKEQTEFYYNGIVSYIDKIKNTMLKDFVKEIFNKHQDLIKIMPAAKLMHHNYLGGLLVHIYECCEIAESVMAISFQKLNSDDVYAACILHDIGKIFEYTIDTETGLIDYNETFKQEWISHSQYGYTLCMSNNFKHIAKMIAAHHGRAEWGAIVDLNEKDLDSSLYIVHHVDDLSAKFGRINISMISSR